MGLYEDVLGGNKRAAARLITLVENRNEAALELYEKLYLKTGRAKKIGITGPPGAGKSTLLDLIAKYYLKSGYKVGIVAVDPTSPYTGGAILGDRIRMKDVSSSENCFIRSMAARGELGGVSRGAVNAVNILDAAGYDYVFIETVGTGQSEIDIVGFADIVLLTTVPGLGDDIQAFKAGVMEIGDIIIINKSDREGAQNTYNFLNSMLSLKKGQKPGIFLTDCINNKGIEEVRSEIDRLLDHRIKNGEISKRRNINACEELKKNVAGIIVEMVSMSEDFDRVMAMVQDKIISPYNGARLLIKYLCSQEG